MKRPRRLTQIQRLLYRNPDGLTSKELADSCGVHPRTILRDLLDLETDLGVPITKDGDRYAILSGYALPPVSFSFQEAIALFLACRLAMRQSLASDIHMSHAIAKLVPVFPSGLGQYLAVGLDKGAKGGTGGASSKIFDTIITAWMKEHQVKVRYLSFRDNQTREWLLDPYFLEMTGVGHSIYVIGRAHREGLQSILNFRLDRITKAELVGTSFKRPLQRDLETILSSAWKMMWEEELERKLWFSSRTNSSEQFALNPSRDASDTSDDSHAVTLHVSGWLEDHLSVTNMTGELELLSLESLKRNFYEYAIKLWESFQNHRLERTREQQFDLVNAGIPGAVEIR